MLSCFSLSWPSPRSFRSSKQKRKVTRNVSNTGASSTTNSSSRISSQSSPLPTPVTIADHHHNSDDDEEDEEDELEEEGGEETKKAGEVKSEVKAEPGASKKPKDANELHTYHEEELMAFKPNQLHADVQLLDGACISARNTAN